MLCHFGGDISCNMFSLSQIYLAFSASDLKCSQTLERLSKVLADRQVGSSQMKEKSAYRNRLVELIFFFYSKYLIPDLKYPILEYELMFDSQPSS